MQRTMLRSTKPRPRTSLRSSLSSTCRAQRRSKPNSTATTPSHITATESWQQAGGLVGAGRCQRCASTTCANPLRGSVSANMPPPSEKRVSTATCAGGPLCDRFRSSFHRYWATGPVGRAHQYQRRHVSRAQEIHLPLRRVVGLSSLSPRSEHLLSLCAS